MWVFVSGFIDCCRAQQQETFDRIDRRTEDKHNLSQCLFKHLLSSFMANISVTPTPTPLYLGLLLNWQPAYDRLCETTQEVSCRDQSIGVFAGASERKFKKKKKRKTKQKKWTLFKSTVVSHLTANDWIIWILMKPYISDFVTLWISRLLFMALTWIVKNAADEMLSGNGWRDPGGIVLLCEKDIMNKIWCRAIRRG